MDKMRICILEPLEQDLTVVAAAQKLKKEVHMSFVFSSCGTEFIADPLMCFIINDFDGPVFDNLHRHRAKILGPTALVLAANGDDRINFAELRRPLFSVAMHGVFVTFTGYRFNGQELSKISHMVQYMGGRVRREMIKETSHLIARMPGGEKYDYADTFKIPIMADSWVYAAWENRRETQFSATANDVVSQHKLKLSGLRVSFLGFSPEDAQTYKEYLTKNKGEVTEPFDPLCTHIVVNDKDDESMPSLPENVAPTCRVVKSAWWWMTMEDGSYQDVSSFLLFNDGTQTPDSRYPLTPSSASARAIKRKRQQHLAGYSGSPARGKRRSSATFNFSGQILDCTLTPDKDAADGHKEQKPVSARQLKFLELVSTETNYVDILNVISSFKTELEKKNCDDGMNEKGEPDNPILGNMETKLIFGNLPPILEVHRAMLEELKAAAQKLSDDTCIGEIILKHVAGLQKAYPPFVNQFETSREMLELCMKKDRFHGFIKGRESRPECGRQTLRELLIRPVQRLASINLLLQDLLKRTDPSHPDHGPLQHALEGIREVLTHINEDKRRTEAQVAILEFFNQIDNCPPDLVSSNRNLVAKCDCLERSEGRKGDPVTIMLLTDTIQICCKRRNKNFTLRGAKSIAKCNKMKPYKHLKHIRLNHIMRVEDYKFSDENPNEFSLIVNEKMQQLSSESPMVYPSDRIKVVCASDDEDENIDKVEYRFTVIDEVHNKANFLDILCQQIATHCMVDPASVLKVKNKEQLVTEDLHKTSTHSLSKAFKFATNAKTKMGRALSLSRTPSRASRILPRRAESTSSANSPGLVRRLQSGANLNDSFTSINSFAM